MSAVAAPNPSARATVFITHATPDDNEFALWLASRLAIAGYRIWVDKRRLLAGDDMWGEIEHHLRNEAIKQVVVFTKHIRKPGVQKELAIGGITSSRLGDPKFMIPIRAGDIAFGDAPPEFVCGDILDAYPNWHDCLDGLFEALEAAGVPKDPSSSAAILKTIVEARERGRRFVVDREERALTNWFPIAVPPQRIRYYRFDCPQEQMAAWISGYPLPHVDLGRLTGSFTDPAGFSMAGPFPLSTPTAYDVPFQDFIGGKDLGPFVERLDASNHVANLLRQHFDRLAARRGLKPVEFASGETGWFFPDGLVPDGKVVFVGPDGKPRYRVLSGKFKTLRWHLCLIARPRIWPELVYRIHGNIVLSEDGQTPLGGDKTHRRRRRLTRSWWNDVWRDRLLAAASYLAGGADKIVLEDGNERIEIAARPMTVALPVSYDATDPPPISEEDEEGTITPTAALDDRRDGPDDGDDSEMPE